MLRRFEIIIGNVLGFLLFFLKFKYKTIKTNLESVKLFNDNEIKFLIINNYKHYGCLLVEFFHLLISPKNFLKNYVRVHNIEYLKKIMNSYGGVFILASHIGNWEVSAMVGVYKGLKINLLTKHIKNKVLEKLWFGNREFLGLKLIFDDINSGAFKVLRALKNGEAVSFVLDQHTYPPIGIECLFFNRSAWTNSSLVKFVQKLNTPIIPIKTFRDSKGFYDIYIESEIEYIKCENPDDEIKVNTQNYLLNLEKTILEHPEQWIWLHKRWKKI